MTDDWPEEDGAPRNFWVEYTTEKLTGLLVDVEIRYEDQAGAFTAWALGSVVVFLIGLFQAYGNLSTGRSDFWPALTAILAFFAFVICVSLRIYVGREIRMIRRLRKLVDAGKYR